MRATFNPSAPDPVLFPKLSARVADGSIFWEPRDGFIGRTPTGEVTIGHDPNAAESYLSACPTPEDW